jgi:signal transduction histidine kinase
MADDVIEQVRRISSELRPGVLDDLGLLAACEWLAHEFERRTGTPCRVRSNLGNEQLDPTLSTAFFRILQEALTNITRHAEAQRVEILLERDDGTLHLRVEDDGRGITADVLTSGKSLGLLGIRERARRIGGEASIGGGPGSGTTIEVRARILEWPRKAS